MARLSTSAARKLRHARGATLMEALVSVLVLSFGVLGAAGMQTASLQANREARNQSLALRYARELAEMMRANPQGVNATGSAYFSMDKYTGPEPTALTNNCASGCGPADLALYDVERWKREVTDPASGGLRGVVVTVCKDSAPYDSDGLPIWACKDGDSAVPVIKMGWSRTATNHDQNGAQGGVDQGSSSRPMIVLPVLVGS